MVNSKANANQILDPKPFSLDFLKAIKELFVSDNNKQLSNIVKHVIVIII